MCTASAQRYSPKDQEQPRGHAGGGPGEPRPLGCTQRELNVPAHAALVSYQEETLMFSSLNVLDQVEYTFYTTFQDHQYKVLGSPAESFSPPTKPFLDLCSAP